MSEDRNSETRKNQVMHLHMERLRKAREERPVIVREGIEALVRLMAVTEGDSGQCRKVAAFLLGLYNGTRFPFDLTDLRALDLDLFEDCMAVLRMDKQPEREIHLYFTHGGERFEQLATAFGIEDRSRS